ncbi:MAG TPA: VOC family protein [Gemmatimonadales bacterium]|nr:VOC family protein [Gemmatimonadales bacterium]
MSGSPSRPPALRGVLETAVYVEDLERSRAFYARLFGLPVMVGDDRFCAFDVAGRDVLLLFRKGGTPEPVATPGGVIPAHDGDGRLHVAFAVAREELDGWEARLRELGVAVESRVAWRRGGRSIYFRDPDGHLLELATPGLWANY